MTEVHLHHLETVIPPYHAAQADIARRLGEWAADPVAARVLRHVLHRSGIERRHSVLPDFTRPEEAQLFRPDSSGRMSSPTTRDRMLAFRRHAGPLAVEVARRLLANAPSFAPAEVTHLITVSCTGFENPGPDWDIVTELGLAPTVERYHLGFMGCYAALPALRLARQCCLAHPEAVVLVVCYELCSLHLQVASTPDALLGNALFSDGAAGALVSARPPSGNSPVLRLDGFASDRIPEGRRAMAWEIGDHGFNLMLSSYVPEVLGAQVPAIAERLLARHALGLRTIDRWAVHPGGRAILDRVAETLDLNPEQIADSREILRRHGNMSSATILFVLRRILEGALHSRRIAALAFGPGLTVESALLERVPARVTAPADAPRPTEVAA